MNRRAIRMLLSATVALVALVALPIDASASQVWNRNTPGVEHLHFAAGPYQITPGANLILAQANKVPKPTQDGFMIRMQPDLRYALPNGKCCGRVPQTQVVHLHHGVWLSNGPTGQGEGNGFGSIYPFMASGEEKTIYSFPTGFGYPVGGSDQWIFNYMIHNLTDRGRRVYVTYDIDFVPDSSPLARTITPVHPIWMDVQDHHIYPVFDVHRGSGAGGRYTYPAMANDPYGSGPALNQFTVDHAGTLIAAAGHLHPGGLYDDLDLVRPGVSPTSGTARGDEPGSVRLFRSSAKYFDKGHQPVSWDFAMTATSPDWRPAVQPGDQLDVQTTYDSKLASWYEVMGIMVVWEAWDDQQGVDPFTTTLDEQGAVTHGHLPENNYYGGTRFVGVNPNSLPRCHPKHVVIAGFRYIPGDISSSQGGGHGCEPTIRRGQSLTFVNQDASAQGTFSFADLFNPNPFYLKSIFHTVTSCKKPCGFNYGISYPVANGAGAFDSGQLGAGQPATGLLSWSTPTSLKPGTYTFFCRIHPWMRGVFRIIG